MFYQLASKDQPESGLDVALETTFPTGSDILQCRTRRCRTCPFEETLLSNDIILKIKFIVVLIGVIHILEKTFIIEQ